MNADLVRLARRHSGPGSCLAGLSADRIGGRYSILSNPQAALLPAAFFRYQQWLGNHNGGNNRDLEVLL
jgi:hypothetical protein